MGRRVGRFMKCPKCGKPLKNIFRGEEWVCDNSECPENMREDYEGGAYAEFYGSTQKQINENCRK